MAKVLWGVDPLAASRTLGQDRKMVLQLWPKGRWRVSASLRTRSTACRPSWPAWPLTRP